MPALPAERDRFPEDLFQNGIMQEHPERVWWVMHTRPRQEKSLARDLYHKRIPFFLPLSARRRRSRKTIITSYVPLFTSYVFLLADPEERSAAFTTSIVRSLPVVEQQELWRDLTQIHRLIASGATVTPEKRLVPGDLVEIRGGPLAGLRGTILKSASGSRFVVQVDFIQRGASILLDDFTLARIDQRSPSY
jgi:transcription antitermination factor NusG